MISLEQRAKISATLMGHPGSGKGQKRPEIGALISGLRWITDGAVGRRIPQSKSLPQGWRYGKPHTPSWSTSPR